MEANKELEERLWGVTDNNEMDDETVRRLADYLAARLSDYLQNPLERFGDAWNCGSAFGFDFRGRIQSSEIFHIALGEKLGLDFLEDGNTLTFGGTAGMTFIDEDFGVGCNANVYLFGNHDRLVLRDLGYGVFENHIYINYTRRENGIGEWVAKGWVMDENWEYGDIEESRFF